MNSRATFESSHAGRTGAYAAGADGMSRSKSAPAPAAVILDPRAKLYLLLLANMLLFFHADARAEALLTALFLTPLFLAGRWRMGLRLTACYAVLLGLGLLSDAATLDTAGGASGAASASGSGADAWIHVVGLFSVGLRMMMPCFITGAYAFSTTRVSEFVCALRRMRVPESAAIPCMVVIRFFPTIGRDYRRTRDAMALRGLASGRLALLRYPAQSLEFVLVPLLMNTTIVSRDLSVAALTKGLGRFGRHTCITEIHSVGLIGRRWRSARSRWH